MTELSFECEVVVGDDAGVEDHDAPLTVVYCIGVMSIVGFRFHIVMRSGNRHGLLPGPENSLRLDPSATMSL